MRRAASVAGPLRVSSVSAPAFRVRRGASDGEDGSSAIEFHAPQESQRPAQRGNTAPQAWQMNVELARASVDLLKQFPR
jgi:hypothetical protein